METIYDSLLIDENLSQRVFMVLKHIGITTSRELAYLGIKKAKNTRQFANKNIVEIKEFLKNKDLYIKELWEEE